MQAEEPESDWDTALDRAMMLRLRRTEPTITQQRSDRWLAPVLVALWIVSMIAHVLALLDTPAHETLRLVGSSTALVLIILGVIWLFVGGRLTFSNRDESPWTALSKSDRHRIRRQLARRAPLEFRHVDVVLELAHQQRRQTFGALAIFAIELPNSLGVALSDPNPVILALTSIGLLLFLGLGLYCVVIAKRLNTSIRRLTQAAAESTPGGTLPG